MQKKLNDLHDKAGLFHSIKLPTVINPALLLTLLQSADIKLQLCVCPGRAARWVASRAKRTRLLWWSISQTIPCHQIPAPLLLRPMLATMDQTPPNCSRISFPRPRQAPGRQTSTTHWHLLVAPQLPWLLLEGRRPPSPVLCPTRSLAPSQVSVGLYDCSLIVLFMQNFHFSVMCCWWSGILQDSNVGLIPAAYMFCLTASRS